MADPAPAPTPEDQLAQKQKEVSDTQAALAQSTQTLAQKQSELQVLQKKVAELQQTLGSYDKTHSQRLDDAKKALDQKGTAAKNVLKDVTDQIDALVKNFQADLDAQKAAAGTAAGESDKAAAAVDTAQGKLAEKQKAYDGLKTAPKDIEAQLQQLKTYQDQINKAETQNDFVAMYFLVGEAKKVVDSVKVLSADDYNKNVRDAQAVVESAKTELSQAQSKAADLLSASKKAQQKSDESNQSRQADVLSALKAVHLKAA